MFVKRTRRSSTSLVGRSRAVLHHPLFADGAEPVGRLSPEQHDAADDESRGTEADPDRRAEMHALIIKNPAVDCKHSRMRLEATSLRSSCNL